MREEERIQGTNRRNQVLPRSLDRSRGRKNRYFRSEERRLQLWYFALGFPYIWRCALCYAGSLEREKYLMRCDSVEVLQRSDSKQLSKAIKSVFLCTDRRSFYWLGASIVLSAIVGNCIMIRRSRRAGRSEWNNVPYALETNRWWRLTNWAVLTHRQRWFGRTIVWHDVNEDFYRQRANCFSQTNLRTCYWKT